MTKVIAFKYFAGPELHESFWAVVLSTVLSLNQKTIEDEYNIKRAQT